MPELPEVETIKRELEEAIPGKKISEVFVYSSKVIRGISAEEFRNGLKGNIIKKILRKGKLLVFELSGKKSLLIHLKMTGQLIYPGNGKKSRVSFKFSGGKFLDFNDQRLFAELRLVDDWRVFKFIKQLGPEPFDIDFDSFRKMLSGRKGKIKPLLMDQRFIAGIGNLYAAEILFRSGVHPARAALSLSEAETRRIFREIRATLKEAIGHGGSSIDQYLRVSAKPGDYAKYHKVYGYHGKPCRRCKTLIERIKISGRGTYFCPKCQK